MTVPLAILAIGAIVAGFVGIPAALGGSNAIEHFLEPSVAVATAAPAAHMSHAGELGLMALSVLISVSAIGLAYRFYVQRPELAERMRNRWARAHRVLLNKYYVDEFYNATAVRGTMLSAKKLWQFDARVVDGAVNLTGWFTVFSGWLSYLFDKYVVDGLVNFVGWSASESSFSVRRIQTGLIQNYALVMLLGVFVFVSVYFIVS